MSVEALRTQIEPFLASKGYRPEQTVHRNCKSYINTLLKFMVGNNYDELTESILSEYMKPYESKDDARTRKKRIDEFRNYVQGESDRTMPLPLEYEERIENEAVMSQSDSDADMATENEAESEADSSMATENEAESESSESEQQEVQPAIKKRGRTKKSEAEKLKREQISLYLDKASYGDLKDIARYSKQSVSDIICRLVDNFLDKNKDKLLMIREILAGADKFEY